MQRRGSGGGRPDPAGAVPPSNDPATVEMAVGTSPADPPEARPVGATTTRRVVVAVLLAAVVALALLVLGGDAVPDPVLPGAPASPSVAVAWSVVVDDVPAIRASTPGRATIDPTLEIAGDGVLHTLRARVGQTTALVRRSAGTGEVVWVREVEPGTHPVVIADGDVVVPPRGRWLSTWGGSRRLVGVSFTDGSTRWAQPIGRDFVGWLDPAGDLFASGNAQCGYLDPASGRFLFVRFARECVPAGQGLAQDSPDGWVVVDPSGRRLAVGRRTSVAPRVVGGHAVFADGERVRVVGRDGEDRTIRVTRLDRLSDHAVGPTHVSGWVGEEQYVLDLASAAVAGPYSPSALPVVVDDELLVVDDGTFPTSELVSAGVWSRSPDANVVRVLDASGAVRASREVVLAPPMLATAEGVLLWEQVGLESTLGLYGYDDLAPEWEVSFRGSPLAGLASSGGLVVASYLDDQGEVRLVGLAPS